MSTPANDVVTGTGAGEILYDTPGGTTVNGLEGNDTVISVFSIPEYWNTVEDEFHGGGGWDTLRYSRVPYAIDADLGAHEVWRLYGTGARHGLDRVYSFEVLEGTGLDDTIRGSGSDLAETLRGEGGDDSISGTGGGDSLGGGAGQDTLLGEGGSNRLDGGADDDLLDGGDDGDRIWGGAGIDSLYGGSGEDTLQGGYGIDFLYGGSGTDLLRYDTDGGVTVNLHYHAAHGAEDLDFVYEIENVMTGEGDDSVHGDALANRVWLREGDDTAEGAEGADTIEGGSGGDLLTGGAGNDLLKGNSGGDTLGGGEGNDSISGDSGGDVLRGGAGTDSLRGGEGEDVVRWEAGDLGMDRLFDFDLAEDRISFGGGFFAVEPAGHPDLPAMLIVSPGTGGDALLSAHTTEGWSLIARFTDTSVSALEAAIDDLSIFAVTLAPVGGGGGGFDLYD